MKSRYSTIIVLSLVVFAMTSTLCQAQEWSRKGKGEVFGMVQTMGGDTTHETITGLKLPFKLDSTTVFGFGFGANATDHWNFNTDFLFGSQDWSMTGLGVTVEGDVNLFLWDVNVDYNILKGRLTPLVTGGIGFLNLSGSGVSETDFSYNLGAGLRWDVTDNICLKGLYRSTWTKLEDTDDRVTLDGFTFYIAYMF